MHSKYDGVTLWSTFPLQRTPPPSVAVEPKEQHRDTPCALWDRQYKQTDFESCNRIYIEYHRK